MSGGTIAAIVIVILILVIAIIGYLLGIIGRIIHQLKSQEIIILIQYIIQIHLKIMKVVYLLFMLMYQRQHIIM